MVRGIALLAGSWEDASKFPVEKMKNKKMKTCRFIGAKRALAN
jgi:hypothetical protein